MITEVVSSDNDRDANFARHGWSLAAQSTTTPWITARIAKNRKSSDESLCVTKRFVVQRLAIRVALRNLEPVPEFEEEVVVALGKQSKFEKFQALDEAFQHW